MLWPNEMRPCVEDEMDQIFGTAFRKQIQQHPLWLRVLLWFFAGIFILWTIWWIYSAATWAWMGYRRLPPSRQELTGRLAAFAWGLASLATYIRRWRIAFYLDPPMRELVTTPGTHWQIFRLGLRARWNWAGVVYTSIFLYPFFRPEWLFVLPTNSWGWREPLSIICAVGWGCLIQFLFQVLSVAVVLLAAAIGVGGAAPRYNVPGMLKPLVFAIQFAAIPLLGAAMTVSIVDKPGLMLATSTWWRVGEMVVALVDAPGSFAHSVFLHFPSVIWFDALRSTVPGPPEVFLAAMLGYAAWLAGGIAAIALFCRAGLSMSARATWNLDPTAPKPADALPQKKRRHDPDHVNGPIEGWLIARVGRMGRAVLRLISAVFDVGAIDRHVLYSLALLPVCLVGAWLSMWTLPELIDAGLALLQTRMDFHTRDAVRNVIASLWIIVVLFYRMTIFGGLRFHVQKNQKSVLPANWAQPAINPVGGNISFLMVNAPTVPSTRGDNRYPLTEIYPVGFSDAVLLPTLYTLLWVSFLGALALGEGLLLGLDSSSMFWSVAIGIPALVQLAFFSAILTSVSNWKDYRRSHLISFVKNIAIAVITALLVFGIFILIVLLCKELLASDRAWVAWLGSINMVLVFDVACYMTARWIYVRRRFDSERRHVKGLAG